LDSNSLLLTEALQRFGVDLRQKAVVGDVTAEIAAELRRMVEGLDLVLVTGGLGPTTDDVTREAAADALGRDLHLSEGLLQELEARFERWSRSMPESNRTQAEVIEGAEILANPKGTAPGMYLVHEGCTLFLFPGVPSELRGLIDSGLIPWLESNTDGSQLETRVIRIACMTESGLEDRIRPAYGEFGAHSISVLASPGDIQVRLTAVGSNAERRERLEAMDRRIRDLVGEAVYGHGPEMSLEQVVGDLLVAQGKTLSTAESCTAGLVAERITRISGSSEYFVGGVVVYSNQLKEQLLGVAGSILEQWGAVSREAVEAMAEGAMLRLESDFSIAISGIAGPAGGTREKPVGTVHLAIAERDVEVSYKELHLPGGRRRVRWLASQWALDLLRRRLQGTSN
jgi:nicotinamide-nucleotide amidase